MNKYKLCNRVYICAKFVFLCDGQPVKQKHKGSVFVQATIAPNFCATRNSHKKHKLYVFMCFYAMEPLYKIL